MKSVRSAIPGPGIQVQYPGQEYEVRSCASAWRLFRGSDRRKICRIWVYQARWNCLCHGGYLCHSRWSAIRL